MQLELFDTTQLDKARGRFAINVKHHIFTDGGHPKWLSTLDCESIRRKDWNPLTITFCTNNDFQKSRLLMEGYTYIQPISPEDTLPHWYPIRHVQKSHQ
jgi:hypothetical protein